MNINKIENKKEKTDFKILTQAEVLAKFKSEPPISEVWLGIPEGSMGLIAGVAKTGKTTFAENLAMSLASGKKSFWGNKLIGKPCKVLYANLEETYRQRSPRNLKQEEELSESEYLLYQKNYLVLDNNFPKFIDNNKRWEILRDYIIKSNAEIIIIDSLTHLYRGSIEESRIAQSVIININEFLKPLDKTIIIVHHNVKGLEKPINQDHIAGSRIISQEFDYAFGLAKTPFGDNYLCHLFNKYLPVDSTEVKLYTINKNQWLEFKEYANKFKLYDKKVDYRKNSKNKDLIYNFIEKKDKLGEKVKAKTLVKYFIKSKVMSRDTLFNNLAILMEELLIKKFEKGIYGINKNKDKRESQKKKIN